jgi:hypothetical protein
VCKAKKRNCLRQRILLQKKKEVMEVVRLVFQILLQKEWGLDL